MPTSSSRLLDLLIPPQNRLAFQAMYIVLAGSAALFAKSRAVPAPIIPQVNPIEILENSPIASAVSLVTQGLVIVSPTMNFLGNVPIFRLVGFIKIAQLIQEHRISPLSERNAELKIHKKMSKRDNCGSDLQGLFVVGVQETLQYLNQSTLEFESMHVREVWVTQMHAVMTAAPIPGESPEERKQRVLTNCIAFLLQTHPAYEWTTESTRKLSQYILLTRDYSNRTVEQLTGLCREKLQIIQSFASMQETQTTLNGPVFLYTRSEAAHVARSPEYLNQYFNSLREAIDQKQYYVLRNKLSELQESFANARQLTHAAQQNAESLYPGARSKQKQEQFNQLKRQSKYLTPPLGVAPIGFDSQSRLSFHTSQVIHAGLLVLSAISVFDTACMVPQVQHGVDHVLDVRQKIKSGQVPIKKQPYNFGQRALNVPRNQTTGERRMITNDIHKKSSLRELLFDPRKSN